jgi:uncharacterized protein YqeY
MININEELRKVLEELKPLKIKKDYERKKQNELIERGALIHVVLDEDDQKLKELEWKVGFLKIIKSLFMEEVVKNNKMNDALLKSGLLTTHTEQAEKDSKVVEVQVFDQSIEERIELIPAEIQQSIFESLAKSHKENLTLLKNPVELEKEKFELDILLGWLPKEVGREEIMAKLKELYPEGIEAKIMGPTIGKLKKEFGRVDGKVLSECVRSIIR